MTTIDEKAPAPAEMLGETCIDGGKCHHACTDKCFRRECCVPLSGYTGPWAYAPAEVPMPEPDWVTFSRNAGGVGVRVDSLRMEGVARYGAACRAAGEAAGYARGLKEAGRDAVPLIQNGEVLVTVTGLTGSGKSAVAGEIEIMCRALGLDVEWVGGDAEKRLTHADWTDALEMYRPRIRIIEANISRTDAAPRREVKP